MTDYLIMCRPHLIDGEEQEYLRLFNASMKEVLTEELSASPLFSVHVVSTLMNRIRVFRGVGSHEEILVSVVTEILTVERHTIEAFDF